MQTREDNVQMIGKLAFCVTELANLDAPDSIAITFTKIQKQNSEKTCSEEHADMLIAQLQSWSTAYVKASVLRCCCRGCLNYKTVQIFRHISLLLLLLSRRLVSMLCLDTVLLVRHLRHAVSANGINTLWRGV